MYSDTCKNCRWGHSPDAGGILNQLSPDKNSNEGSSSSDGDTRVEIDGNNVGSSSSSSNTANNSDGNWRHLQNDPDFVFTCLEHCPFALTYAGPVPRSNEACVLAAVIYKGIGGRISVGVSRNRCVSVFTVCFQHMIDIPILVTFEVTVFLSLSLIRSFPLVSCHRSSKTANCFTARVGKRPTAKSAPELR